MTTNLLIEQTTLDQLAEAVSDRVIQRLNSEQVKKQEFQQKPVDRKITVNEFCRRAEISRRTYNAWKDKGLVKPVRIGGRFFLNESEVSNFFKS